MTSDPFSMVTRLHLPIWLGTIGKCWATNSIAAWARRAVTPGHHKRLLDLGAGRGTQWARFLKFASEVDVTIWDADSSHLRRWTADPELNRVAKLGARDRIPPDSFDVVTSFSVLEHVPNVTEHLRSMHGALKAGGLALVVWDDGHFRPTLDFRHPVSSGVLALKDAGKWAASARLGSIVPPSHFQRPRSVRQAVESAEHLGFRVELHTLCGIPGVKSAVARVDEQAQLEVMNSWLDLERSILGWTSLDSVTLGTFEPIFGSRLLVLQK